MEKRYQVFVSSTFRDLQEERKEVMQALLELKCIPAGMELFLAADDDQWSLVKSVIDDCDYYVVILGGRYGSTHPVRSRISYTEMDIGMRSRLASLFSGFVHREPQKLIGERLEDDPEKKQRRNHFRQLVLEKHVRFWTSAEQLGSVLSRSMINLISNTPAVGWIRSDQTAPEGLWRCYGCEKKTTSSTGSRSRTHGSASRNTRACARRRYGCDQLCDPIYSRVFP